MDISLTAEDAAFRDEVIDFIAENLKPEWQAVADFDGRPDRRIIIEWQRLVAEKGWLTTGWPPEYGGRQLTPMQKLIFNAETARARAPLIPHMEFGMIAPLIYTYGDQAQKDYFLPRLLRGEDIWAQGFSEPGSGSDLASVRTSARLEGDQYVVSGQKIWTTNAHIATQLLCLVRTDAQAARPQLGISMLLIPMDLPGIKVRPIRSIDGWHHFNEVFLDDVLVPASRRLGEENLGWSYAKALLAHERQGIAEIQPTRVLLEEVATVAAAEPRAGGMLIEDRDFARRFSALEVELDGLEMLELRAMQQAQLGTERGYEASLLKLAGSRLRQEVMRLGVEALGALGEARSSAEAPIHPSGAGEHFVGDAIFSRATTIYGGTSEVQRNIVSRLVLGGNEVI